MKLTDKPAQANRPQTPKPPFPYEEESVSYQIAPGGVTLAGTLTLPTGKGPFSAVILITGSGAHDRDETIFEHKPFLVLADALTRRGIAVLRLDDRGVGGSTGNKMTLTTEDLAGDVLTGVTFLKNRSEIDGRRIGLIGHSEGGVIAPIAATRSNDVAFVVLMAGTGLPGDEIVQMQTRLIYKAAGLDGPTLDRLLEFQRQVLAINKAENDDQAAMTKIDAASKEFQASLTDSERKVLGFGEQSYSAKIKDYRSPWFRFFQSYDPRPTLAKVRCPVLALIGEKDLQVPPKENLAEIEAMFKKAGNIHATVKELPALNHLFQNCKTGAPAEYAQIEETIAPSALTAIGDWIVQQTAAK